MPVVKPSGVVEEPGTARPIFGEDENGNTIDSLLAWAVPADEAIARHVLAQAVDDEGRSGLTWFRLQNGDLILGVFPRAETYEMTEMDPGRDDFPAVPVEDLADMTLRPATWPVRKLKTGYYACVNDLLQLATTSFLTPEAMTKNADIVRVTPETVAGMRRRYLENCVSSEPS